MRLGNQGLCWCFAFAFALLAGSRGMATNPPTLAGVALIAHLTHGQIWLALPQWGRRRCELLADILVANSSQKGERNQAGEIPSKLLELTFPQTT